MPRVRSRVTSTVSVPRRASSAAVAAPSIPVAPVITASFGRRVAHPDGRRATVVELTDAGHTVHRQVYARHADRAAALFAALSPADRRQLARALGRLASTLAATSAAQGRPLELDPTTFRVSP